MYYFKPPGARGQALHQDQYYLRVQPGTCIAAWMAVDRCDRETGCLQVVPDTRDTPVLCTEQADHDASFTNLMVPLPARADRPLHRRRGPAGGPLLLPGAGHGREVALEQGPGGGPCGVWVDRTGRPTVEMQSAATT